MKKPELLAPAGDLERAKIAIRYGADAVYLGGQRFSLRSRASNFSLEAIQEACSFAKEYGARIHVTVNLIPHQEDLVGLDEYLLALKDCGVTAFIMASPSLIRRAKEIVPECEVHLSTQMSSCNSATLAFWKNQGVDRAVLARECTLDEIEKITATNLLPTEVFIHGAMCANWSGQCVLSNLLTLRDANRGGCAQSCRWRYHLLDQKEERSDPNCLFTMGSKDLMAMDALYPLMKAEVSSFKIEGRMKSLFYVATVVRSYRKMIDLIAEKERPLTEEEKAPYLKEIQRAENRPFGTGFLLGDLGTQGQLYDRSEDYVTHDFVGIVTAYDAQTSKGLIQVRNKLQKGEDLEVFGPHTEPQEFFVEQLWSKDHEPIEQEPRNMVEVECSLPTCEVGDLVRRSRHVV